MSKSSMKEMELKKTITQVLISVSIFSLVVSWCSPTLLHNQNLHYYFSCNSFHLISFTMNKNCIFLICNAILVVVANTSPFHLPPPASDLDDMLQKRTGGGLPLQTESEVLLLSDKYVMSDESSLSSEDEDDDDDDEAEEREVDCQEILEHCKESGDEVLISIEDADHQNERQDCRLLDTVDDLDHREEEEEEEEEEEDGDGDGDEIEKLSSEELNQKFEEEEKEEEEDGDGDGDEIEKLSSEELNQKFEDFIRRMKEEFRVNEYEKQQLVLVK